MTTMRATSNLSKMLEAGSERVVRAYPAQPTDAKDWDAIEAIAEAIEEGFDGPSIATVTVYSHRTALVGITHGANPDGELYRLTLERVG